MKWNVETFWIILMDLCNRMSISCQAADGNNDYTVIYLIWRLPEQTCFCNDRYFSRTLKLDAGYPLSSSIITCRSVGFPCMVWSAWVVIAPLLADVPDNAYEYSFFLRFFFTFSNVFNCILLLYSLRRVQWYSNCFFRRRGHIFSIL